MEVPGDCPVCKRLDSVQLIMAIYNESFSTTRSVQPQTAYGADRKLHTRTTPVTVTQQTMLGQLLSPPKPRNVPLPLGEWVIVRLAVLLSFVFYGYGQISGLFTQIFDKVGENEIWEVLALIIAFPFLIWLLAHFVIFREANLERRRRLSQEKERCELFRQQWEQFCYCRRCNAVYISGSIKAVPPEQMEQLYYD